MTANPSEMLLPSIAKVSFYKVIESLEELAKTGDEYLSTYATSLLSELEAYPELRDGFQDRSLFETYKPQIDKLMRFLFPPALTKNEIKAATPPMDFIPFHLSERFQNIIANAGQDFEVSGGGFEADEMYIMVCTFILKSYYKRDLNLKTPLAFDIPNQRTGMKHYYKVAFNADMMEVIPTDKAIEISDETYYELLNNIDDVELWKAHFPPNSWIIRGIGLINLMESTIDQAVSDITSNLLSMGVDAGPAIEKNLGMLFEIPDLRMGLVELKKDTFTQDYRSRLSSILLHGSKSEVCVESLCGMGYTQLIDNKEPMLIPDVEAYAAESESMLGDNLIAQKIGSYMIVPLEYQGEFIGYFELASPRKNELNSATLKRLNQALPILSMAAGRIRVEEKNRIEALIQAKCTTIHPSVKWKFEQEAERYLKQEVLGETPVFNDIVFKEIYPLYGQLDIRNSSTIRNRAVKTDLLKQMKGAKTVLEAAFLQTQFPAYEALVFRVDSYMAETENGLLAGSEHKILQFLKKEIYPVFEHLKTTDATLAQKIAQYLDGLHPDLHMVYEVRKNFDDSVNQINDGLAEFLDAKQEVAQDMFPHYFERYKTDGVEFNMYIGDSVADHLTFDPIHLNNLRLWQLITMCEMESEFSQIQSKLPMPLEVASLILVYNTPLSIQFRMDEKRFDVEGAYNARYEIVKKRVDKALIKDSDERVTCAGKIAIVYTSDEDAEEYLKYIKFLVAKGYIEADSTEQFQLQDLQGITGLKALRVKVALDRKQSNMETFTFDEVMKEINEA